MLITTDCQKKKEVDRPFLRKTRKKVSSYKKQEENHEISKIVFLPFNNPPRIFRVREE